MAAIAAAGLVSWARRPRRAALDRPPPPLRPAIVPDIHIDAATALAVNAELAAGNKIAAIKLVRTATGCDLKAAKDKVERIAAARSG